MYSLQGRKSGHNCLVDSFSPSSRRSSRPSEDEKVLMKNQNVCDYFPQIAKAVIDLTAHDLLKQKFPSRPSERMHMVGSIISVNFETIIMWGDAHGKYH